MHHCFAMTDRFFRKACKIGVREYQRNNLGFDIALESGRYNEEGVASIVTKGRGSKPGI